VSLRLSQVWKPSRNMPRAKQGGRVVFQWWGQVKEPCSRPIHMSGKSQSIWPLPNQCFCESPGLHTTTASLRSSMTLTYFLLLFTSGKQHIDLFWESLAINPVTWITDGNEKEKTVPFSTMYGSVYLPPPRQGSITETQRKSVTEAI
jgi:hypothetical protein